jgi:hypothetical protein
MRMYCTAATINIFIFTVMLLLSPWAVKAGEMKPLSITMESYDYPYQVDFLPLTIDMVVNLSSWCHRRCSLLYLVQG